MDLWIIWLSLTVLLIIVELISTVAITLCLATGTFVAFIASLCGASLELQLILLAVGVVATLPIFPRLIRYYRLHRNDGYELSNMDALIGRRTVVYQPQNGMAYARIKIDGDSWQAQAVNYEPELREGDKVEVVGFDSIVLLVKVIS